MTAYSEWPERTIPVATLLLDPQNPRIPSGAAHLSQRQVIEELVEHDDVYELARDIARGGYIPAESLIGTSAEGKTIILEGNRRLAALKLLLNPGLAATADARKFQALAEQAAKGEQVKKVRVLLAPNRDAAAALILRKHTRDQVQRWSPLMQARFYRNLTASGRSVDDLAGEYGIPVGQIASFLKTDAMYEVARSIDLPDSVQEIVRNPREFPASVLQRLIEIPKARNFLALDFDEDGRPSSHAKPEDFRRAYARILTDIAQRKIDTRILNTVADADSYLKGLADVAPNAQRRSFTAKELSGEKQPATPEEPESPKPSASRARRRQTSVVPPGLRCTLNDQRAREIFDEVKRVKANRFPNAHAVLLRILLEFGIANYLNKTGRMKTLLAKHRTAGKGKDWFPSLRQMLPALLVEAKDELELDPRALKAINQLISQKDSLVSVDTLDAYIHNPYRLPDERQLRAIWLTLAGVFELVLHEPAKPSKAPPKP